MTEEEFKAEYERALATGWRVDRIPEDDLEDLLDRYKNDREVQEWSDRIAEEEEWHADSE
jgi:hypothetical protein